MGRRYFEVLARSHTFSEAMQWSAGFAALQLLQCPMKLNTILWEYVWLCNGNIICYSVKVYTFQRKIFKGIAFSGTQCNYTVTGII